MSLSSPAEIKKRLEQNWLSFLKANAAKLSLDRIDGSSPPSVFVGRFGYPKVRIGPMIPPLHGDTEILDKPELWAGKSLEDIANYRLSLVRGVAAIRVGDTSGRLVESLQDLAMSETPVDSEATFERQPFRDLELEKEIRLNSEAAPFGPAAPLKQFRLAGSSGSDRRVEQAFYDTDLRASDAILQLYRKGVETSRIHKVLSVGMLGRKKGRKLVPTRWSITATDDTISKSLVTELEGNPPIDTYEVYEYRHLSNHYAVVLIPDDVWSFEMIESWFTHDGMAAFGSDYEGPRGLDHYPSIAGAYFAGKLAVCEHLDLRKRKGAALVLREIQPEYVMPLGVWQVREGVRGAMENQPVPFENLNDAVSHALGRMSISMEEVRRRSKIWENMKTQLRMTEFT